MQFRRGKNGVTRIVRDSYRKKYAPSVGGKKLAEDWWTLKNRVLKRDNYRCCQCKAKHGSDDPRKPGSKVWLDVHHIRELSRGGTTTMANLISLCRRCHNTRHSHHF